MRLEKLTVRPSRKRDGQIKKNDCNLSRNSTLPSLAEGSRDDHKHHRGFSLSVEILHGTTGDLKKKKFLIEFAIRTGPLNQPPACAIQCTCAVPVQAEPRAFPDVIGLPRPANIVSTPSIQLFTAHQPISPSTTGLEA